MKENQTIVSQTRQKQFSLRQNSLFNSVGTIVFYVCLWALSVVVMRLGSGADVGMLQLAMTVTNVFSSVANYNMRAFQISDVRNEYSAGHYTASRILTGSFALLACLVYSLFWGYSAYTILCIGLYMLFRLSESAADVLHGVDQKSGRMDHVMVSYVSRGLLMLAGFALLLKFSGRIDLSIAGLALITWLIVLLYDVSVAGRYDRLRPSFDARVLFRLLRVCLPGMLAAVAFTAIVSIPRQYLGKLEGDLLLGYYATVSTPLVFVQVLLNSLMNPAIGDLAESWSAGNLSAFWKLTLKLTALVFLLGALTLGGVALLAQPVMTFVFGASISPYVYLMIPVTGCAVLYAVSCITFNLLVILRKLKALLIVSLAALLFAVLAAPSLIRLSGANGVSFCVMAAYILFILLSLALVCRKAKQKRRSFDPHDPEGSDHGV